jgi:hypothetical protein
MSSSEAPEVGNEFVVVVTSYPTTYGCNSGREWTEKEFLEHSDSKVYGSDGEQSKNSGDAPGFKKYQDAVGYALQRVDRECKFTEHDYTEDSELPFDSADCQNYNDKETRIDVMTKTAFAVMMQFNLRKMGKVA